MPKSTQISKELSPQDFDAIKLSVASTEQVLSWSYGEVTKPETINYRTQKPERDGLFDEKIFGPTKDWECYCGKYKKIRYKGVICDKCGVEVTRSSVRRERMGHIDLAVPVTHIWYVHGVPSVLGQILEMTVSDLEKVIYFAGFIVIGVNQDVQESALAELEAEYKELSKKTEVKNNPVAQSNLEMSYKKMRQEITTLAQKQILTESQYHDLSLKYGQIVTVGIGAEAIADLLKNTDAEEEIKKINDILSKDQTVNRKKLIRRQKLFADMVAAGIKPEFLVTSRLPVIPPDLRPMVQLDGGRFAASDLNDLYRRVLNRNNRLKRLIKQGAPEVIQRNEKRMLQEAVDSLIDNSARRGRVATTGTQRKLRSLSDILRGKQGRFRQNLLGKRVDYSGRSVIVIGPDLKLNQCGLPKMMALELFKTFVIAKLIADGHVHNVKNATRIIERREPIVWDILEEITKEYYVMLNRAPTLHRLSIQAFQPVLIEGKAIQIHPLVCYAFNADFDGDQMAVHVPLSEQARWEASEIMRSSHNLLKPASGEPVVSPRLDIVLGCFYMTTFAPGKLGENKIYANKNEAITAYQKGSLHLRSKILVRVKGDTEVIGTSDEKIIDLPSGLRLLQTSIGRVLFNNILPEGYPFFNQDMNQKNLKSLVSRVFKDFGSDVTSDVVDKLKELGFEYATLSGLTISIDDIMAPNTKEGYLKSADKEVDEIEKQFRNGLINTEEKSLKTIELWTKVRASIEKDMIDQYDKQSPVWLMVSSGARGSVAQITQMAGMKGLVVNPAGQIIELPVKSNYREGLSVLEYFISTHGSRKGKSDTSLRTSDAGYLTRRLVDVSQDVVIKEKDCKTKQSLVVIKSEVTEDDENFGRLISGRTASTEIKSGAKVLVKANEIISDEIAAIINANPKIESIQVRSPMVCETENGLCQLCYGRDLATGVVVKLGEAVGIMAAQAIGEPGTQLTMKTFHLGGVLGEDITSGLPRVEELFEARSPRNPAPIAPFDGTIDIKKNNDRVNLSIVSIDKMTEIVYLPDGHIATVKDKDIVKPKQVVATAEGKKGLRTPIGGQVKISKGEILVTSTEPKSFTFEILPSISLKVQNGDTVTQGQILTEGHLNLNDALRYMGEVAAKKYIIRDVKSIYNSQGQPINDKHVEIIVRQMFSKHKVIESRSPELLVGDVVDIKELAKLSKEVLKGAKTEPTVMGITRVALKTNSFLAAASFQETTNVLIEAAIRGAVDHLTGLKENVIIGKLIPAGTGYKK